jgi:hypothetical protein
LKNFMQPFIFYLIFQNGKQKFQVKKGQFPTLEFLFGGTETWERSVLPNNAGYTEINWVEFSVSSLGSPEEKRKLAPNKWSWPRSKTN